MRLVSVVVLVLLASCGRSSSPRSGAPPAVSGGSGPEGAPSSGGRGGGAGAQASTGGAAGSSGEEAGAGGEEPAKAGGTGGSGGLGRAGAHSTGTAGASAGLGGSAGAAGATAGGGQGGQRPLPLPEDCEPRGRSEDAESCSLYVFCGPQPNLATCTALPSGRWRCRCDLANSDRIYELDGAVGLDACAVAAGLCNVDDLELGEEECPASRDESNENYCDLALACERPIDVGFTTGVDAWLMSYGSAVCSRDREGLPLSCECARGEESAAYGVLADDGALACRPLADFCRGGAEPVFDDEELCMDGEPLVDSGGCNLDQVCANPMPLTDDVSLALLHPRGSSCTPTSGGSRCSCSRPYGDPEEGWWEVFAFEVEDAPGLDACAQAVTACDDDAVIESRGPVDCRPQGQSAGLDFCTSDLACLEPATVDGRDVVAHGRLLTYCRQLAPGDPWWCSCASNQETTIFELGEPTLDAWDACSAAPAGCLERMSVHLGAYGDLVSPPDPIPELAR